MFCYPARIQPSSRPSLQSQRENSEHQQGDVIGRRGHQNPCYSDDEVGHRKLFILPYLKEKIRTNVNQLDRYWNIPFVHANKNITWLSFCRLTDRMYTTVQSLMSVRFFNVFERSLFCSPRRHLINQK